MLGNAFEFFDFTVYGVFAVIIGRVFFPVESELVQILLSLGTFGIGFLTRPLGSIVFGAYADRAGRKPAMMLTIWLMAIGTGGGMVLSDALDQGSAKTILYQPIGERMAKD